MVSVVALLAAVAALPAAAVSPPTGGSCPSDAAPPYSDVSVDSFAFDDSRCLRELGISESGDTYRPGDDMTRSKAAAFMANAYAALTGTEAPVADHMFADVSSDPNADDIARIFGLGITTGTSATTYSPDNPVVRGHMALFLTRLYKAVTGSDAPSGVTPFTDIGDRPDGEQAAIGAIYALGVTTGTSATTYSPHSLVTREQMASLVARMYRAIDTLPDPVEVPGAPTGVEASVSGDAGDALDVSWTAPEDSGSSDITSYVLQWTSDGDDSVYTRFNIAGTAVNVPGLSKGTVYTFRVAAVSDAGQGDWATVTGTPVTTPGPVVDLRALPVVRPGTVNVLWDAPADDGGAPLTGYMVEWAEGNGPRQSVQVNDPDTTSHTLRDLNVAEVYYVWVVALNAAGDGDASDYVTAEPAQSESAASTAVRVTEAVRISRPDVADAGGRFASLSWPTVTPANGQSLVDYTIQRRCGSQLWPDAILPNDVTRIVVQEAVAAAANQVLLPASVALLGGALDAATPGTLENGVECSYRVRANTFADSNSNGSRDADEPVTGVWVEASATPAAVTAPQTVPAAEVPAAPAAVSAVAGNRSVQVDWTLVPASGQGTGGPVTGYEVALFSPATVLVASVTVDAGTDSFTFTGLSNGWAYVSSVAAVNASGAGATATAAAAVPGAAPNVPTNVRVAQGTARVTTLSVAWTTPRSNSLATVTGYVLQQRTSATATAAAGEWAAASPQPAGTAATVEVAGLTAGTSYDFRVRAIGNTTGVSSLPVSGPWSAVVSGTPTKVPEPVVAANVEVVSNDGSLTLAWSPAVSNGSAVTGYTLTFRRADGVGYNPWRSAGSVAASLLPSATVTGLENGVAYEVRIVARNAQGSSEPVSVTGTPASGNGSLSAPASVTATVVPGDGDGSRINVAWTAVSGASSYTVEYLQVLDASGESPGNPVGNWSTVNVVVPPGTTRATITGLVTDAAFVVRVRAAVPLGRFGFSSAVTAAQAPVTAPTGVNVVYLVGTTTLRVQWVSLNAADTRNQKVTGYKVSWAPVNPQVPGNRASALVDAPPAAVNGSPMVYYITGLTVLGQSVLVTVQAVNHVGAGVGASYTYPPA